MTSLGTSYLPNHSSQRSTARDERHCRRSKDELIIESFQWTPKHGQASFDRSAKTYLHQLCVDAGCYLEDLPRAMDDREEWREISALSLT